MTRREDVQAYPLHWPEGWSRRPSHSRILNHPFGSRHNTLTFDRARRSLADELGRLGAMQITLSTNVPLRMDGAPYSDAARRRMDDPGVSIYSC